MTFICLLKMANKALLFIYLLHRGAWVVRCVVSSRVPVVVVLLLGFVLHTRYILPLELLIYHIQAVNLYIWGM